MRWFCSFKAYGDMVIACHALREADPAENGMLCGTYLRSLNEAIGYSGVVSWLDLGCANVPAMFDVKKHGMWAGLKSLVKVRWTIQNAPIQRNDRLVVDRLSLRERLLGWPRRLEAIEGVLGNVYADYRAFLKLAPPTKPKPQAVTNLAFFPDSRVAAKQIPPEWSAHVQGLSLTRGFEARTIRVGTGTNGERERWIDGFPALVAEVRSADAVVSADSLPAHIAEYLGKPVFVISPRPNLYWLPLSAFTGGFHSLFGEEPPLVRWLDSLRP